MASIASMRRRSDRARPPRLRIPRQYRGASVIPSMLSRKNVAAAIGETLAAFVSVHGATDFKIFKQLLGLRLVERNRPDATDMLLTWKPAPSGPAAQKSNAPGHRNPSYWSERTTRNRDVQIRRRRLSCAAGRQWMPLFGADLWGAASTNICLRSHRRACRCPCRISRLAHWPETRQ